MSSKFFAIAIVALLATSCSPRNFLPLPQPSKDSERVDTTYVFDSIYIDRIRIVKEKADTIYVTDWKTEYKYKYKDRYVHDTTTIREPYPVEVIKEVEKELNWWQKFRLKGFWVLFGLVGVWVVWKIARKRI